MIAGEFWAFFWAFWGVFLFLLLLYHGGKTS